MIFILSIYSKPSQILTYFLNALYCIKKLYRNKYYSFLFEIIKFKIKCLTVNCISFSFPMQEQIHQVTHAQRYWSIAFADNETREMLLSLKITQCELSVSGKKNKVIKNTLATSV